MKSPIFIFSLPRSGSTLLQRVLMGHKDIASVAEPWLILPFVYAYKEKGSLTEYSHGLSYEAFEEFINSFIEKEADYYNVLAKFLKELYEKKCQKNEQYFLDKTPRYYNIIPEIAKIFPDAKFIFLFRNPVSVMSSMMRTWSDERFKKMFYYDRDLQYGPQALSEGYELLKDKVYGIQYEKYLTDPVRYTKEICKYLQIDFDDNMISDFSCQNTKGRLGDPTGIKQYNKIDAGPLEKWKETFNTPFRKWYIKKYVNSIDEAVLAIQGYNKNEIIDDIENNKVNHMKVYVLLQDLMDVFYSNVVRFMKPNIWFGKKSKTWARDRYLS